ncbi:coiled-coil domain-containing protein [Streptacidiphilus sp. PAMC 29251]
MHTQTTTETPAELRAQAQALHDQAAQLRAELQAVLTAGQQEADRLRAEADQVLAGARNKANRLRGEAGDTDRSAGPLEERAVLQEAAAVLVAAIPAAESRAAGFYAELEALGVTITGLLGRLEQLGVDREEVGMQLAAAREAGDVDGVVAARARMTAIDEVVASLEGQKRVAEQRVVAVGAPGEDGELDRAEKLVVALIAQQRQVANQLDPDSLQAQADALMAQLVEYAAAQVDQEQQNQPARRANTIIQQ